MHRLLDPLAKEGFILSVHSSVDIASDCTSAVLHSVTSVRGVNGRTVSVRGERSEVSGAYICDDHFEPRLWLTLHPTRPLKQVCVCRCVCTCRPMCTHVYVHTLRPLNSCIVYYDPSPRGPSHTRAGPRLQPLLPACQHSPRRPHVRPSRHRATAR